MNEGLPERISLADLSDAVPESSRMPPIDRAEEFAKLNAVVQELEEEERLAKKKKGV